MGVSASQPCGCLAGNETEEMRLSRGIDRGLRETRRNLANTPKVLLLGAGESGKSTIIKQMRILNNVAFSEYERELYRVQVFYNLVGGMRALLEAMRELEPVPGSSTADLGVKADDDSIEAEPKRLPPFHVDSDTPQEPTSKPSQDRRRSSAIAPSSSKQPLIPEEIKEINPDRAESEVSRSPTRSPSLSLNIFNTGALSTRQHAALLNELHYIPDIRPGEPFPIQYEGLLKGLWWGWPDADEDERPAGECLDRIQSETGIALPDNLGYFYASPQRLSYWFGDEYVPSDQDVLQCRGRTTGIQETIFTLGKNGLGQALREHRSGNGDHATPGLERFEESVGGATTTAAGSAGAGTSVGAGTSLAGAGTTTTMSGTTILAHTHRPHASPPAPPTQRNQTGSATLRFPSGKARLHLVDVGGQRSERRKWMHCFQDVTAVLFLVGLSGYSQGMLEDPSSNQMQDAMTLWDGVCSSQWFKNTSLILFLNKCDLFGEKLVKFPIKNYFADYEGADTDVVAAQQYFKRRFLRVYSKSIARRAKASPTTSATTGVVNSVRDKGKGRSGGMTIERRTVYSHFTTATDTTQLKRVMVSVCDIILRDNLLAATFL